MGWMEAHIVGHVPRRVEFRNAALQLAGDIDYTDYKCHKCVKFGHVARICPGPPTNPTLDSWQGPQQGRGNQRGRGQQGRGVGRGGNSRGGNFGGYGGRGGSRTVRASDRNWAAAAQEEVRFTQEEIDSDISI